MIRRVSLIVLLLFAVWGNILAKFVQEVELKDGTILVGHVYKQIPGKSIIFHANRVKTDPMLRFRQQGKDYNLKWEELKIIRRSVESETPWSYDRLTMNDDMVYTGEIIEQEIGISVTLLIRETGKKMTLNFSDMKKMEKVPANTDKDLWLDRSYTNRLVMNDNTSHEGLIVLQYRGSKSSDCYVELLRHSGKRVRVFLPDIKEYIIILR